MHTHFLRMTLTFECFLDKARHCEHKLIPVYSKNTHYCAALGLNSTAVTLEPGQILTIMHFATKL